MRGRWAAGIVPRNFVWIIQDHLAVSERPGGQTSQHRKVRRQEEIIWLKSQGFTRVVSLLPSPHNLHAYDERGLPSAHFSLPAGGDPREVLDALYPALLGWLQAGDRILMHQDELSERVSGVIAGFLCWCKVIPELPNAIVAVEQLMKRQMGSAGRSIVAVTPELTPPPIGSLPQRVRPPAPAANGAEPSAAAVAAETGPRTKSATVPTPTSKKAGKLTLVDNSPGKSAKTTK
jgi:hypothetical protein